MGTASSQLDPEVTEKVSRDVNDLISKHRVVIFAKNICPYCHMAKNVFIEMNEAYHWVDLSKRPDGREMQYFLADLTGQSTVPRVFVNGKCIGGGQETQELYKKGILQNLLNQS
ncbi:unnamed protein product [Darwinula stevensoni]|uniref:Glutaredoxin-2, mitochondrial n=1 Tax=Darwinula stevensoni TaxID=69355 RepID=A0A7R8WYU2_9CRUS|nr:unnamed protein product [Darwinula stevensoni]CAG0879334.1 unnamed protein product [Darwinula stevensoni]